MVTCSFATVSGSCTTPAVSAFELIPKRTDTPISAEIRKALVWPNVELATTVKSCGPHRETFKRAAQVVMAEVSLSDETVFQTVTGGVD